MSTLAVILVIVIVLVALGGFGYTRRGTLAGNDIFGGLAGLILLLVVLWLIFHVLLHAV
jgi:hypothetical protein